MDFQLSDLSEPIQLPVIPMKGVVSMPGTSIHVEIGNKKSVAGINLAFKTNKYIFVTLQKDIFADETTNDSVCSIGVIAKIKQIIRVPHAEMRVQMMVICRAKLGDTIRDTGHEWSTVMPIHPPKYLRGDSAETDAMFELIKKEYDRFKDFLPPFGDDAYDAGSCNELGELCDRITQLMPSSPDEKQHILETVDPKRRAVETLVLIQHETEMAGIEQNISKKVSARLNKNQRDYYIREQIRALQEELGAGETGGFPMQDIFEDSDEDYERKIELLNADEYVKEKLTKEVNRLSKTAENAPEASVIRDYIETCLELPWKIKTKDNTSVSHAEKVLNDDHYGLAKVKERILEMLSVRIMSPDDGAKAQILCLIGPPGTGKTSIASSIAKSLGRKFVRISLGGVHDEAEIRGHRRTYIGSMPGKIITAIKEAGSSNPLILLDEIDKLGSDYKGDPSSALLEVLDPEQNKTFRDNYIDMPFDLSDVLFITTANNDETIPQPLYDRMDVIELSSYTSEEKFQIAKLHLMKKQMKKHGLTKKMLSISDSALRLIIDGYVKEAGVRQLERTIATLCRKADREWLTTAEDERKTIKITDKNLEKYLGPRKFKDDRIYTEPQVGIVTGLAYTSVGGDTMPIEVNIMDGTGKLELTGSLGDVMKESAHAAVSHIRSNAQHYAVKDPDFYKNKDIHIHVPEGAVPKDGPSAGVTITTALISILSDRTVRNDVAMTGEITLRGRVLPIGGLREKTMAAYKAGIKTVIIPEGNMPDLYECEQVVKDNIKFVPAKTVDDVINTALI